MSVSYSIDVTLDLFYTEENIKYIVAKGKEQKFTYLDFELCKFLSVDEVVQKILYSHSDDEARHVRIKFQDTFCFLWFFKSDNGQLIFSIGSFGYKWDRDFSNGRRIYTIDFARYIRLMLEACNDVSILELNTDSDITEDLVYEYQNCAVAFLNMGVFGKDSSDYTDYGRWSVKYFLANATQNGFEFFDENTGQSIEPSVQKYYDVLKAGFPAYLYAKKDGISFKIEIKQNNQGYDLVSVYPLEPYLMKKGYGSEDEKIDAAFYVQRLIELCENFAIYELKTFF
jgi:hypothetical protein